MEVQAEVQIRSAEGLAAEQEEILGRHRLRRALVNRDALEEFIVAPEEVAGQYGVTLTERELEAVQRSGHFAAEWDRRCGAGRWVDVVRTAGEDPRRATRQEPLEELIDRAIRDRIAEEILEDVPLALRTTADRLGADALVRPERDREEIPEALRPIRRMVGDVSQRITRALERELNELALYGAFVRRSSTLATAAGRDGSLAPTSVDPIDLPIAELRRHLITVSQRAIEESLERTRAEGRPSAEPQRRPARPQPTRIVEG